MIFQPFYRPQTGCAAYVFGCGGQGLGCVVDPHEDDVDAYLDFAAAKGLRLTHVFETHVHADHRSGARALAARAGAAHVLHRSAQVGFAFTPVDDGQVIELGNTHVRVLHTPGHTPESMCLVVTDQRRGPAPWFVCTGDALFVGAVGRPDLPGHERDNARTLHASLGRLLELPDELEIYPAHFGGSACGAGLSGKPTSTIGFERRWNPMLSLAREAFVEALVQTPPPRPPDAIAAHNRGA
jgi:hydroxyacylglutathione hydrolase